MSRWLAVGLVLLACMAAAIAPRQAHAQQPFGGAPAGQAAPARSAGSAGFFERVRAMQAETQRRLTAALRAVKAEHSLAAALTLVALSFAYGVIHAVGPGHGKAVLTSYALADAATWRRGAAISLAAALVQALSALLLVGIMVFAFRATGASMQAAEGWLERVSFAAVAVFGAVLLAREIMRARRPAHASAPPLSAATTHTPAHAHHRAHHGHAADCGCGHAHLPTPKAVASDDWSLGRAAAMAIAIGIRPCTGAILVLVFAIAQGMAWAGVVATFAMALGTALTVAALAASAVGMRGVVLARAGERAAARIGRGAAIAGYAFIALAGSVLFIAALGPQRPF